MTTKMFGNKNRKPNAIEKRANAALDADKGFLITDVKMFFTFLFLSRF